MTRSAAPNANPSADIESAVRDRYAASAEAVEPALCCPTDGYDPQYLKIIPDEILEKDYGCGDPSRHVAPGETVVDLGSGAGKICYILAQKLGPAGRVIGLDFNDAMLNLARRHAGSISQQLGYTNFSFHKARIQDLALDLDAAQQYLADHPVSDVEQLSRFEAHCDHLRRNQPLLADDSVDVIVSNCVLNLVKHDEKHQLFHEMARVLRPGGRAVISDIVCDEEPTAAMRNDPDLWSGCISGAFREDRFLEMFEQAGFHGVEILSRAAEPWQTIDGIAFRAMTVRAYVPQPAAADEPTHAVVYRGPWKEVRDEHGRTFRRGQAVRVPDSAYQALAAPTGPYAGHVIATSEQTGPGTISLSQADNCSSSDGCC